METITIHNQISDEGVTQIHNQISDEGVAILKSRVYVVDILENNVHEQIEKSKCKCKCDNFNYCRCIMFIINILLCIGVGISIWQYNKYNKYENNTNNNNLYNNTATIELISSFNEIMLNIIYIFAICLLINICILIRTFLSSK